MVVCPASVDNYELATPGCFFRALDGPTYSCWSLLQTFSFVSILAVLHMHMISCIQRSCSRLPTCLYLVVSVFFCLFVQTYTQLILSCPVNPASLIPE